MIGPRQLLDAFLRARDLPSPCLQQQEEMGGVGVIVYNFKLVFAEARALQGREAYCCSSSGGCKDNASASLELTNRNLQELLLSFFQCLISLSFTYQSRNEACNEACNEHSRLRQNTIYFQFILSRSGLVESDRAGCHGTMAMSSKSQSLTSRQVTVTSESRTIQSRLRT